ncbi:MAG: hypothetical protein C0482_00415 [Gordonia sp.]|jgi:lysylphosphatidylglycerol synthetase-like protein (DUF2156 family)|uniref:hypothetical protein n=1 Tax=Williamsia sp. 1138 TaxID=1903117 RepID=UPI000A0FF22F|nr:hypothetical protein [Williamsia sp. 1138]MBA4020805.1 hypothetical protein [Gordonia sp. (in: high G+C Gram-positive bacteria)]OZG28523.1 hypothetical protein BH683_014160 [Williamsia sp. 1138]
MIVASLIVLGAAAAAPVPLARFVHGHQAWRTYVAAGVVLTLLGVVAILALLSTPARGTAVVFTHLLVAAAAITGGTAMVRGSLLIGGIEPWQLDTPAPAPDPADPAAGQPVPTPLRGGRVIGYLERLVVVAALGLHWPEAIAIVLAVKGLGRYPELREPGAAEQFIIGTLASVVWAAAVAGVGHLLLH